MRISDWSSDVCSSDLKGRSIKDTINQISPTIASAFETLKLTLGGNGDLQTRAQDLQTTIGGLQDTINQSRTAVYRSEEHRIGKACVGTCRSRWSPYHSKKKSKRENKKII